MSTGLTGCLPIRGDDEGDGGALTQAFKTLLLFSFLLLSAPIFSFFISRHYFEDFYGCDPQIATIYAAVLAVVLVHLIVGLFIYVAWKESNAHTIPPAFKQD